MTVIEKLREQQEKENLTDEAFAQKLHSNRVTWYAVRTGKQNASAEFLGVAQTVYPQFSLDIMTYLKELGEAKIAETTNPEETTDG